MARIRDQRAPALIQGLPTKSLLAEWGRSQFIYLANDVTKGFRLVDQYWRGLYRRYGIVTDDTHAKRVRTLNDVRAYVEQGSYLEGRTYVDLRSPLTCL